jgi:hypothetical protein
LTGLGCSTTSSVVTLPAALQPSERNPSSRSVAINRSFIEIRKKKGHTHPRVANLHLPCAPDRCGNPSPPCPRAFTPSPPARRVSSRSSLRGRFRSFVTLQAVRPLPKELAIITRPTNPHSRIRCLSDRRRACYTTATLIEW